MKRLFLAVVFAAALSAQSKTEAAQLPPAVLAEYWRTVADRWAQQTAFWKSIAEQFSPSVPFEARVTAKQSAILQSIRKIDNAIDEQRRKLQAACGAAATLDESGTDPVCKPVNAASDQKGK